MKSPRCEPWCWNTHLHEWAIFGLNVGRYSSMEHLGVRETSTRPPPGPPPPPPPRRHLGRPHHQRCCRGPPVPVPPAAPGGFGEGMRIRITTMELQRIFKWRRADHGIIMFFFESSAAISWEIIYQWGCALGIFKGIGGNSWLKPWRLHPHKFGWNRKIDDTFTCIIATATP